MINRKKNKTKREKIGEKKWQKQKAKQK